MRTLRYSWQGPLASVVLVSIIDWIDTMENAHRIYWQLVQTLIRGVLS